MEFSVNQIAAILEGEVTGDGDQKVHRLGKIEDAGKGAVSFLSNPKYENFLYSTNATAVIVSKSFKPKKASKAALIHVDDPYSSFTALLEEYHKLTIFQKSGIETPTHRGAESSYGEDFYQGAFSYIGDRVTIGNNVKIYPQAFIGDDVQIGDNTIVYAGAKIYSRSIIGNDCVIHAGAVIGSDGFGFAPQDDGSYKTIPQLGNVIIKNNVDIGANTVVDCATLESTIIHNGVKLDNLIQVAHNVEIGKNTVIAAQSGISGSTKIGEQCIIGGQVGIIGHLKIANKTSIGAKSGVSKSVQQEGKIMLGEIALERNAYLKSYAIYRRLPEILDRIKQLEEKY